MIFFFFLPDDNVIFISVSQEPSTSFLCAMLRERIQEKSSLLPRMSSLQLTQRWRVSISFYLYQSCQSVQIFTTSFFFIPELPVNIVKPLQDKMALEYTRVLLDCTVSNPRCSIRWYKGRNVILPSGRFEICSEGCYRRLVIQEVTLDDAGMYSVQVGENTSSARLTVEGETKSMVKLHTH